MNIEYEATFPNISKDDVRERLEELGAACVKPEFLQKRVVFNLPEGHEIPGGWLRVRDEGDKITLSLKIINGTKIEDQKEIQLSVDSFADAESLVTLVGCQKKAYQENKREIWKLSNVEIMIDEWPYLEPLVEVEGPSEQAVRDVSESLGFDYSKARFCAVGVLIAEKYGIDEYLVNNRTPRITFADPNPYLIHQIK